MRTIAIVLLAGLIFFSASGAEIKPEASPVNAPEVLLLKVDYTTNQFEGGHKPEFMQLPETFTLRTEYEEPGDFGWIKVYFSELDELLFHGDIVWGGCGDIIYPATWLNADEFEYVLTEDYIIPSNGFENIFNPEEKDYDYTLPWSVVQGIVDVRQMLAANPRQRVKLFLYTPSVGAGDPADWKWIIFLAGENLPASFFETSTHISGSEAELFQNYPNPFNQSTVIRYILPQTGRSAQIVISNTAGKIIRQIPLPNSGGTDSITIEGGALSAGIYYYSLYVDNRLVDTKQMILTK
ncbi:MAG: T9SS type A sorting domain-containing protein [Dysgonamonadaceae bacterium]|jgi:hypothetical protein|nr:T9SS type A sorting domain-containing protein [Dysgonamonadaceae bacterium]